MDAVKRRCVLFLLASATLLRRTSSTSQPRLLIELRSSEAPPESTNECPQNAGSYDTGRLTPYFRQSSSELRTYYTSRRD
jgi:hypothetical protein